MGYKRQGFVNGQVVSAENMNKIEDGILEIESATTQTTQDLNSIVNEGDARPEFVDTVHRIFQSSASEILAEVNEALDATIMATQATENAINLAGVAVQNAQDATANANEAAQTALERSILTARKTFAKDVSVSPTSKGNVIIEKLGGDTYQESIPGNQLFDASKLPTKSAVGVTVTNNGDGSFTISGSGNLTGIFTIDYEMTHEESVKLLKSGVLNLKCEQKTLPYIMIRLISGSGEMFRLTNRYDLETHKEVLQDYIDDETSYLRFQFYGNINESIIPGTIKPMLYQDGDGTWEPFVGGKPAPNPEAPQTIEAVGDKGWFDGELLQGKYADTVGTPNNAPGWVSPVNKIPCKAGDGIELLYDTTATTMQLFFYDSSNNYVYHVTNGSTSNISAIAPDRAEWFAFSIGINLTLATAGDITVTINGTYAVIVDTNDGRTYIPLSSPLYEGDYIRLNDSKYEVVRNRKELVFNGNEIWYKTSATAVDEFSIEATNIDASRNTEILSTHFKPYFGFKVGAIYINISSIYMQPSAFGVMTLDEWKAYLAEQYANGTPVKVVYQLAEPIIEPIRHKSLYEITATEGVTNIGIAISDNLSPENIFRFPRSEDGALETTNFADNGKLKVKVEELETKLATMMLDLV